jgi:hypothetical protein
MLKYNLLVKILFWFSLVFSFVFWLHLFFADADERPKIIPGLIDSLSVRNSKRLKVIDSLQGKRKINEVQLLKIDSIIQNINNDTIFYNNYIKRFRPEL